LTDFDTFLHRTVSHVCGLYKRVYLTLIIDHAR